MLLRGVRLDTGVLATSLGISRATLFRRSGNREAILADALWASPTSPCAGRRRTPTGRRTVPGCAACA